MTISRLLQILIIVILAPNVFIGCKSEETNTRIEFDQGHINMMADLIFANKVYSKTSYNQRDSVMENLISQIEEIHGIEHQKFRSFLETLQDDPDHYKLFLDSVTTRITVLSDSIQQLQDSVPSNVQRNTKQQDRQVRSKSK